MGQIGFDMSCDARALYPLPPFWRHPASASLLMNRVLLSIISKMLCRTYASSIDGGVRRTAR